MELSMDDRSRIQAGDRSQETECAVWFCVFSVSSGCSGICLYVQSAGTEYYKYSGVCNSTSTLEYVGV